MDHNGMPEEEDLEYNLWQGDETEVKPWHPLHAPAPFPENEDERVEALLAEVCARVEGRRGQGESCVSGA
eukprot:710665-Hanusia_phi.AAC.2